MKKRKKICRYFSNKVEASNNIDWKKVFFFCTTKKKKSKESVCGGTFAVIQRKKATTRAPHVEQERVVGFSSGRYFFFFTPHLHLFLFFLRKKIRYTTGILIRYFSTFTIKCNKKFKYFKMWKIKRKKKID